jgi:L-iditol 2-dehydrogenase
MEVAHRPEGNAPPPGFVRVRIACAAICGSDLHYFRHGGLGSQRVVLPFELGHEASGIVTDPNGCAHLHPGDLVAIEPLMFCGECAQCASGRRNLCQRHTYLGAGGAPGAMCGSLTLAASQLVPTPPELTPAAAAMLEPLSVAQHAVERAQIRPGDTVAVFGSGAIGILIGAVALGAGASRCLVLDPLEFRLRRAQRLVPSVTPVEGASREGGRRVLECTEGRGVDVCFEAAGDPQAVCSCVEATAPGGRIVVVGIAPLDFLQVNFHPMRLKQLDLVNVRRSRLGVEGCLPLVRALRFPLDALVTHSFPLADAQQAFEHASMRLDDAIRTALVPDS